MKHKILISIYFFTVVFLNQGYSQTDSINIDTLDFCKEGNDYYNSYQFDKALNSLSLCYKNDVKNIDCLKKIAQCNYKLGRLKESKNNYLKILGYDSVNILAINQLGVIYANESKYNKSIKQYEKLIVLDSTNSFYYKRIGQIFLMLENIDMSIKYLEKEHSINPKDISVIADLSNNYQKINLLTEAESLIRKGINLDSSNVKVLITHSKIAYKQTNYDIVINTINQVLKIQKDTSLYMMKFLGISHFLLKDYQKSIFFMEMFTEQNQDLDYVYYYLGLAHRAIGDFENSVFYIEKAIEVGISNNISIYYTSLAITYEENENYKESIQAYQEAYRSSKNKILLYHLARNYEAYYSDKETALLYYEKYLAMNDSNNIEFKEYSKYKISELKETIHFKLDTLE